MFYLSIFGAMLTCSFTSAHSARGRLSTYKLLLILLFFLTAFRFEVGCDWSGYMLQYGLQQGAGFEAAWAQREPLWWITIELLQRLELSYPWLNVTSSAIFFAGIHTLARRQPDPLAFLILLFPILILNMPMSGIRQGAAIGLMCIAFTAFVDRRLVRFIMWTAVAAGFHSSSLLFLLLTPLVGGSYSKKRIFAAGLLAIPGSLLIVTGEGAEVAILRYVDSNIDAFGAAYRTGTLFLSAIFFYWFLRRQWKVAFPFDYKLASLGALMMLAVFPLTAVSSVIADRLGYYFIPLQAMIFARTPFLVHRSQSRILTAAPYLGLALVLLVWTATSWHFSLCYIPYKTWLFGFPDGALSL